MIGTCTPFKTCNACHAGWLKSYQRVESTLGVNSNNILTMALILLQLWGWVERKSKSTVKIYELQIYV